MTEAQWPAQEVRQAPHGMIASVNTLSSATGLRVLREGGNAMDAAIAAGAVLTVVEPWSGQLGGDAFLLVASADQGTVTAINGSGAAPHSATIDQYRGLGQIPESGWLAASVPGIVHAWQVALTRFGTRSLGELLSDAITYAEAGFPLTARQARSNAAMAAAGAEFPETRAVFFPDGRPPGAGFNLRQPDLARTLRTIRAEGAPCGRDGDHVLAFPNNLDVLAYAEKAGTIPLPPYIRRAPTEADRQHYQTVFARHPGAVAAPTAGLHFTERVFDTLRVAGVRTVTVTLHVGPGTFKPVTCDDIREHTMDAEWYDFPQTAAKAVNETKQVGGRVIAVGTTAVRVLETAATHGVPLQAGRGTTSLFISPGHDFKIVDGMLTNFHLPKSTLFMLVCALAGRERMVEAYQSAAAEKYRFYSYGDAMLIL